MKQIGVSYRYLLQVNISFMLLKLEIFVGKINPGMLIQNLTIEGDCHKSKDKYCFIIYNKCILLARYSIYIFPSIFIIIIFMLLIF